MTDKEWSALTNAIVGVSNAKVGVSQAEAALTVLRAQVETLTKEKAKAIDILNDDIVGMGDVVKQLRAKLSTLRDQLAQLSKAARVLADKVDATSKCDHSRRACEDIGCIGAEVKAVRAVLTSPDTETK